MVLAWVWVMVGLALLLLGGEALVRGASGIALFVRLRPAVVGLTVVAAGTSMPELVVSIQAALQGNVGLSVGNVVGSNIFNIGATLGVAALLQPLLIQGTTVRLEWPVMLMATLQLYMLIRDAVLDRTEGAFLLCGLITFVAYMVWIGRNATTSQEQDEFANLTTASFGHTGRTAWILNVGAVVFGGGMLAGGSSALVVGAVQIATALGLSETTVGLTVVAAGTSAPELAASAVASLRGKADIAVANIIGSNIFNCLGIAGATAIVHPLVVAPEVLSRDSGWMIGLSMLLFPLMKSGLRVSRLEGATLASCFLAYWWVLLR